MTYAPLNNDIYSAAFAGAMAQCVIRTGQSPTLSPPPSYTDYVLVADAWAQAVDTVWTALPATTFQINAIQTESETYHTTHPVKPSELAFYSNPANWTIPATALVTAVRTGTTPANTPTVIESYPYELDLSEVWTETWFGGTNTERLQPSGLLWVDDDFSDPNLGRFTLVREPGARAGTLSIAAGIATLTETVGVGFVNDFAYEGAALGHPQSMVTCDFVSTTGAGAFFVVFIGWIQDGQNRCGLKWELTGQTIAVEIRVAGVNATSATVSTAGWTFPAKLGISMVGNQVTIWRYTTSWTVILTQDVSTLAPALNLKTTDLSTWYGCFGMVTPGTATCTASYDNFKVGAFGSVGVRDQTLITNPDGSPVWYGDGIVRVVCTAAGYTQYESYLAVFEVDLKKKNWTQMATIMTNRGGARQPDTAGHIVVELAGQHFLCSSWATVATSPVRVLYKWLAATDVTIGRNVVDSPTTLALTELPGGVTAHQFDPMLIYTSGSYYITYAAAPNPTTANGFFPVVDQSNDLAIWVNAGKDITSIRYEGTKIVQSDGTYFVLAAGQYTGRCYSFPTVNFLGTINIKSPGTGVTQPHTMLIPYGDLVYCLSFDNTEWPAVGGNIFSWGNAHIFASPRYQNVPHVP